MDPVIIVMAGLDLILLIVGIILSQIEKKSKNKNKKATDTIWKLVEYVTMAFVGYLLGGNL